MLQQEKFGTRYQQVNQGEIIKIPGLISLDRDTNVRFANINVKPEEKAKYIYYAAVISQSNLKRLIDANDDNWAREADEASELFEQLGSLYEKAKSYAFAGAAYETAAKIFPTGNISGEYKAKGLLRTAIKNYLLDNDEKTAPNSYDVAGDLYREVAIFTDSEGKEDFSLEAMVKAAEAYEKSLKAYKDEFAKGKVDKLEYQRLLPTYLKIAESWGLSASKEAKHHKEYEKYLSGQAKNTELAAFCMEMIGSDSADICNLRKDAAALYEQLFSITQNFEHKKSEGNCLRKAGEACSEADEVLSLYSKAERVFQEIISQIKDDYIHQNAEIYRDLLFAHLDCHNWIALLNEDEDEKKRHKQEIAKLYEQLGNTYENDYSYGWMYYLDSANKYYEINDYINAKVQYIKSAECATKTAAEGRQKIYKDYKEYKSEYAKYINTGREPKRMLSEFIAPYIEAVNGASQYYLLAASSSFWAAMCQLGTWDSFNNFNNSAVSLFQAISTMSDLIYIIKFHKMFCYTAIALGGIAAIGLVATGVTELLAITGLISSIAPAIMPWVTNLGCTALISLGLAAVNYCTLEGGMPMTFQCDLSNIATTTIKSVKNAYNYTTDLIFSSRSGENQGVSRQ